MLYRYAVIKKDEGLGITPPYQGSDIAATPANKEMIDLPKMQAVYTAL
ncbi:hypothetical protein [Lelliottia sp. RWM.1]|nr:hypothetical protein [Lelliottia sp. RWM.1]MBM3071108.1 hypothetical protein [Lelliottia sp. RWM.1]